MCMLSVHMQRLSEHTIMAVSHERGHTEVARPNDEHDPFPPFV